MSIRSDFGKQTSIKQELIQVFCLKLVYNILSKCPFKHIKQAAEKLLHA